MIESGKVGVFIDGEERATLGTGEYFGEMALLTKTPRSATVKALTSLTLLYLSQEIFNRLLTDSKEMKQAAERAGSRRALSNKRWSSLRNQADPAAGVARLAS